MPSEKIEYVPDPVVAEEFHVTLMTLWRWDHSKKMRAKKMRALGWPPRVQINGRNYRSRNQLEAFKQRLAEEAA
jgi:hypothetical protein